MSARPLDELPRFPAEAGDGAGDGPMAQQERLGHQGPGGQGSSSGLTIPDVATVRATAANRKAFRGKRSALQVEILQEYAPKEPKKRMTSDESLQVAREAKAKKTAEKHKASAPAVVPCEVVALSADLCGDASKFWDKAKLELVAVGSPSVFGATPLVDFCSLVDSTAKVPDTIEVIVDEFCRNAQSTVTTMAARVAKVGVDRRDLAKSLSQIACAAINTDQRAQRAFIDCAQKAGFKPVLFAEVCAYDETPMKVRCEEKVFRLISQTDSALCGDTSDANTTLKKLDSAVLSSDVGPTKLFQTALSTIMLLKDERPETSEDRRYLLFRSQPLTTVQYLETSSSEVLHAALRASSCIPASTNGFDISLRIATSDRLAANMKAERQLTVERGQDWLALFAPCDVHCVAGSQTKTLALVADLVSNMVNLSLSLRVTGNMRKFRACFKASVTSRLVILDGDPPVGAELYRTRILNLFLARGANAAQRRVALSVWLNGEWRNHHRVEHYRRTNDPMGDADRSKICEQVTEAVLTALASRAPTTFPRSRWTGSDRATDEVGLLLAVHGLLYQAYTAFLIACGHKPARQFVGHDWSDKNAINPGPAIDAIRDDEGDATDAEEAPGGEEAGGGTEEGGGGIKEPGSENVDWQKMNAQFRFGGWAFIRSQPLGKTILLRRCIEPFRELFAQHFRVASEQWEAQQRAQDLAYLQKVVGAEPREYRVAIVADCRFELECTEKLRELLSEKEPWECLPPSCFTVGFRSLAFRMLSRAGCSTHQLLTAPHSCFPFKLFLLLVDESLADLFADVPECLLDDFSRSFVDKYRGVGLASSEPLMVLRSIALVWKVDISDIESKHASLRRLLMSAPQTKAMSTETLSALWTCHQVAKRQSRCGKLGRKSAPRKREASPAAPRQQRKRSAWAAFCSEKSQGQALQPQVLKLLYRQLSKEEKQRLQLNADRASALVKAGRVKRRPFHSGLASAIARAKQAQKEAVWKRDKARLSDGDRLSALTREVLASGAMGTTAVALAKREARIERGYLRSAEAKVHNDLRQFREEHADKNAKEVCATLRQAAVRSTDLVAFPSASAACFDYVPDAAGMAARCVTMASTGASSSLSTALSLDWNRRCQMISDKDRPRITERTKEEKRAHRCRLAGVCLCSAEGKRLAAMANKLNNYLKSSLRLQPKEYKELLLDGSLVVAITPAEPLEGMTRALEEDVAKPDFSKDLATTWLQIGLHYLNPYRPTFHRLTRSTCQPFMHEGVSLKATAEFHTWHAAMNELDLDTMYWVGLFRIWESDEPLAEFVPGEVCVSPLVPEGLLWYGAVRKKRAAAKRAGRRPDDPDSDPAPLGDGQDEPGPEVEDDETDPEDEDDLNEMHDDDDAGMDGLLALAQMFAEVVDEERADRDESAIEGGHPNGPDPGNGGHDEAAFFGPELEEANAAASSTGTPAAKAPPPPPLPPAAGQAIAVAPPPPPAPAAPRGRGRCPTKYNGGIISFYPDKSDTTKGRFQATCPNAEKHGMCRLTRTCNPPKGPTAQGRPLGLLAAWLRNAYADHVETAADHMALVAFLTLEEREAARAELMLEVGADGLAGYERPRRPNEGPEPEGLA